MTEDVLERINLEFFSVHFFLRGMEVGAVEVLLKINFPFATAECFGFFYKSCLEVY